MSDTQASLFAQLCDILEEQFDIDAAEVRMESTLREDLDIDSIDAVNLMIELKRFTQRKLTPADFNHVRTVADVIDVVQQVQDSE